MATTSRVSLEGWRQGDDTTTVAQVSLNGWCQETATAVATFQAAWASQANTVIQAGAPTCGAM